MTTIISLSTSGAELLTDQHHPLYGAASEIIRLEPLDKPTCFELSPFYSAWLAQLPGQQRVILEKLAGYPDQPAPALARGCRGAM